MLKYVAVPSLLLSLFAVSANSQSRSAADSQKDRGIMLEMLMNNPTSESSERGLLRERNAHVLAERQSQLRRDTAKLVTLTAELKEQVDRTSVNLLSLDVIRKAHEIQKLAKSVQDRMKYAY
jgi:hypothetical protein